MDEATPLQRFMLPGRVERLRRDVERRTQSVTVVLDGVHDPHNISAVARSAEAFGLLQMHVVESNAPCRINPQVSQGAEKWLTLHTWAEPRACAAELNKRGFELWIADPQATSSLWEIDWTGRIALVFGNEHLGLSAHMSQAAHGSFSIPLQGFSQSLNVSVAAGITLAAVVQWRRQYFGRPGDLDEAQQARLLERWQRLSVKHAGAILARLAGCREGKP